MRKRMGYLKLHEKVALKLRGLTVWAYSKTCTCFPISVAWAGGSGFELIS